MMARPRPPGPVTLDSACDCDWSGPCDPCKAHDFRRNGGAAYRLLVEDIEARALLARDAAEVAKEIREIRAEIARSEERADYCETQVDVARGQWRDKEARDLEEEGKAMRQTVRYLKKRLVQPEAWLDRARAVLA